MWEWLNEVVTKNVCFVTRNNELRDDIISDTLFYFAEYSDIAIKVYSTKSIAYVIKIMKSCLEGNLMNKLGLDRNKRQSRVYYKLYKDMVALSERYSIPLTKEYAYKFMALTNSSIFMVKRVIELSENKTVSLDAIRGEII